MFADNWMPASIQHDVKRHVIHVRARKAAKQEFGERGSKFCRTASASVKEKVTGVVCLEKRKRKLVRNYVIIQRSEKWLVRGLVKFVPALP